jgi:hypothetical protein
MGKSIDEVIGNALMHGAHPYDPNKYDPQKAHDYYEAHKHLKGRRHGSQDRSSGGTGRPDQGKPASHKISPSVQKQIDHLTSRLHELQARLRTLLANAKKSSGKKDDGHKTAAEKSKDARDSKKYREAHKTELANKSKKAASKSGGGGHSSGGISSMTESEVRAEIARVRSSLHAAIAKARAASRGTA